MKKMITLFALALTCGWLHAQTTISVTTQVLIKKDTISSPLLAVLPMDTNVVSYEVTIINNHGQPLLNTNITGTRMPESVWFVIFSLGPGSKVYYNNIKARTPNGGTTRRPNHLFVIK